MSCEIRLTASLQNVPAIRRCLFPTDDNRGSDSWLHSCKISTSPTAELIGIAHNRRLVVLTSKWDSSKSLNYYQITFSNSIHEYDKIKGILCLPVIGHGHGSHIGPDWTCIIIAYDSGYVRFYTEHCDLLMEEQFHNENITAIKCQSQHNPRPDLCPDLNPEELYIQYQSNVCVIAGQQLFENLKYLRGQFVNGQTASKLVPLNIRKWGFQDQSSINDVTVVGLNLSNTFDHLLTASICGGFDAKYRNTAPNSTLVIAAGSKPYLGFHYALEGVNQPVFSDVAKAVADKLKSAIPSWLMGSKTADSDKVDTVAMQPIDNMGMRFGLSDLRRSGLQIFLSPNKKLMAVSDSLGRVSLIDSFKGIVLKVLKGYREAQCAFLNVPDERHSKHRTGNKVATFLVIYSPKKGTLEIFTVQQGTKICTFSVSKYNRLLYIPYGLMGFSATTKSRYICSFTCIFMENNGDIHEIFVPFHFALAEKNSVRAKDIHLYKKMRQLVKSESLNRDDLEKEVYKICTEIKTTELKMQSLEMLINSKDISAEAVLDCTQYFLSELSKVVETTEIIEKFKVLCSNVKSLVNLFIFTTKIDSDDDDDDDEPLKVIETLNLDYRDLGGLQKLLDLATASGENNLKTPQVRFLIDTFEIADFLECFDLNKSVINLKTNSEEYNLFGASEALFAKYISGAKSDFEKFAQHISLKNVAIKDLFTLLIHFWVNRKLDISLNLEKDMYNFYQLVKALLKIAVKIDLIETEEMDSISEFWQNIRENLAKNSRPFPALMAAMLFKKVAEEQENLEDNIEIFTQEKVQWSLLIGKLEDISILNIILSMKPTIEKALLPKLTHERIDVSLKYILEHGKGSVSELTSQWLTSFGIDPNSIIINEIIYKNSEEDNDCILEKLNDYHHQINEGMYLDVIEQVKLEPLFKYLNILKRQFPYSLEANNILANMCWEYALAWRKNINNLNFLKAALKYSFSIRNESVRNGLFQLIWNTHLKIVLESSSKLINKVGKLPKDRLCVQDTGLTDKEMTEFLGICTEFIDAFLESAAANNSCPTTELIFEAIWENDKESELSLFELILQQKNVDYNLLHLHYQLCMVLRMITHFSVKHSKPLNTLFEASLINLFFTDLQKSVDVNWNKSDIKINNSRDHFLRKIIAASLETVSLNENGEIFCKIHVEWMEKCLLLGRIWNLGIDSLKRFQITQLYVSGYDLIAQDLISAVNEQHLLGEELLQIAANRLSQYLSSSPYLGENIAALSPILTRYMDSFKESWCSPSDLENIQSIANHALICIGGHERELSKLAELLIDALKTLKDIQIQKKS